ncbi:hypothetical protein HYU92_06630 [Candidatus Curtissbacteria bacterium]|nr:hypothetical protein [Candidatus Curtissbacteria bacterium]
MSQEARRKEESRGKEISPQHYLEALLPADRQNVEAILDLFTDIQEQVIPNRKAVIVAVGSSVDPSADKEPKDIDLRLVINGPYNADVLTKLSISIFNALPLKDKNNRVVFSDPDTDGEQYKSVTMHIQSPLGRPIDLILPTKKDAGESGMYQFSYVEYEKHLDERVDRYLEAERKREVWLGYQESPSAFSVLRIYTPIL